MFIRYRFPMSNYVQFIYLNKILIYMKKNRKTFDEQVLERKSINYIQGNTETCRKICAIL